MAEFHHVTSFEDLIKLTCSLEFKSNPIYVFLTGAKDAEGISWCPDCVKAEPVVEKVMKTEAPANSHFISVSVQRDLWKDPKCVFRTDSRLRLSYIPALVRWPNSDQKLQMEQCANPGLIRMLFEED